MKIITIACDIYADIAPAYHYLLQKHWPDCPHEIEYVTNSEPLGVGATVHYLKGTDIEFGRRFRKFVSLHCKDDELILIMMVDYLVKGLNIDLIEQARELCERDDIAHCRLRPMPAPQFPAPKNLKLDERLWGEIDKFGRYSLSLQPGIWNPKALARCIKDTWSPWQCETNGSGKTKNVTGHFLCTRQPAIVHLNYYRKGKPQGVGWVKKNAPEKFWPDAARGKK